MVKQAVESYILIDASKVGYSALLTYAYLNDIDYIVTDKPLQKEIKEYTTENSVSVLYAQ